MNGNVESSSRGAPPLPIAERNTNPEPENSFQWQNQDGEQIQETPRITPPTPSPTSTSEQEQVVLAPVAKEEADETVPGATTSGGESGTSSDRSKHVSYTITKGWLSDSIDALAYRAGYEMMWAVGRDGKADFAVHRDFTLTAVSAQEALSQVVEPFPIRMCLFQVDKIAKVVPEDQACQ